MACLETTFVIDYLRGDIRAKDELQRMKKQGENITIASPTVMEIITGASLSTSDKEKEEIVLFISSLAILPLDRESSFKAGEIEAKLIMGGDSIEKIDIMIAAIAIQNNEAIITRNKKHFEKIQGLKIKSY